MTPYVTLSLWDLALTSLLVLIDAGLSAALRLGVHPSLLIAAVRMVVQLAIMGAVLTTLFALVSPLWTGLAALGMALFAGREIAQRQERPFDGLWSFGIGTFCMMLASGLVMSFALLTAIRPDPWYDSALRNPAAWHDPRQLHDRHCLGARYSDERCRHPPVRDRSSSHAWRYPL